MHFSESGSMWWSVTVTLLWTHCVPTSWRLSLECPNWFPLSPFLGHQRKVWKFGKVVFSRLLTFSYYSVGEKKKCLSSRLEINDQFQLPHGLRDHGDVAFRHELYCYLGTISICSFYSRGLHEHVHLLLWVLSPTTRLTANLTSRTSYGLLWALLIIHINPYHRTDQVVPTIYYPYCPWMTHLSALGISSSLVLTFVINLDT